LEGFDDLSVHASYLSMLLDEKHCAGVSSGLDSGAGIGNPMTHGANGAVGFSIPVVSIQAVEEIELFQPSFAVFVSTDR
jgi:hypothetical protein